MQSQQCIPVEPNKNRQLHGLRIKEIVKFICDYYRHVCLKRVLTSNFDEDVIQRKNLQRIEEDFNAKYV